MSRSLAFAPELGEVADSLGRDTWRTFSALASLGATDLTTARVLEPYLDALAILGQAGNPDLRSLGVSDETVWGVYAAHGPGHRLTAEPRPDGRWELTGSKPWCLLDDRLVHVPDGMSTFQPAVPARPQPRAAPPIEGQGRLPSPARRLKRTFSHNQFLHSLRESASKRITPVA